MSWLNPTPADQNLVRELARETGRKELYQLAQVLALALRVEPLLLRNARLHFLPASDTELETDLWFAEALVRTCNNQTAALRPGIARELCNRLRADDPERFRAAKKVIGKLTRHWSETDRLEQEMRWAILNDDAEALREGFGRILNTLRLPRKPTAQRELVRWVKGALPDLTRRDQPEIETRWLYQFVSAALGSMGAWLTGAAAEPLPLSLINALPRVAPQPIALQVRRGVLEALAPGNGLPTIEIALPLPTAILLRCDAPPLSRWEGIWIGRRIRVPETARQLTLQTLDGNRYRIEIALTGHAQEPESPVQDPRSRVLVACMPEGRELARRLTNWLAAQGVAADIADDGEALRTLAAETRLLRLWTPASAEQWRDRPAATGEFAASVLVVAGDLQLTLPSAVGGQTEIIRIAAGHDGIDQATGEKLLRALALDVRPWSVQSDIDPLTRNETIPLPGDSSTSRRTSGSIPLNEQAADVDTSVGFDDARKPHPDRPPKPKKPPRQLPNRGIGKPIRLLHLSDLHFRVGKAWDSDPVLRSLIHFIAEEVRAGLVPDLVVITGDIASSGKAQEYALAREWLEGALWPVLNLDPSALLPRDRLLIVPGNHDVDRSHISRGALAIQDSLLNEQSQDAIAEILSEAKEGDLILKRHAAYLDFHSQWLGESQPLPWWQRTIEIGDTRLHVAGLDSAWMASGDQDRGRLLLGRWQINQTVLHPDGEGADWRLALLHHPWDYLAEFDAHEARPMIHLHRDLVLLSDLHASAAAYVQPSDPARAWLELATGALDGGSPHLNAFQWIELFVKPKRVRVLFRAWIKGAWTVDYNQPDCPDGTATFQTPAIPAKYLAWLRRTYGAVDLLGQDTQQGQAVTLSQVYVPALTQGEPNRSGQEPVRLWTSRLASQDAPEATLLLERLDRESLYCPAPSGAGKSTFCRWAVLQSIADSIPSHPVPAPRGFTEPVPADLRTRLPLLVPLREFWEVMDCGRGRLAWSREELEQALADWVDRRVRPDGLTGALLRAHLAAGSTFLLLDGLDEVPLSQSRDGNTDYPRTLLLAGLADALPHWERVGNRTLITSRPYGLDQAELARLGLPRAPLEPLPSPLQRLFVTRWFHTLDRTDLAAGLIESIQESDDLTPLAENPLLLTVLCVSYGNGRRLPQDRYHLYQQIIDKVLFNRYPGDARQREPVKARLEAIAYGMHTGADLDEDRQTPSPEASDTEIERLLRAFARLEPAYEQGRVAPAVQREELLTRSGLLLPRPGRHAAFYHLSFQEFLAAERISRTSEDRAALELVFRRRGPVAEWRPTLLFLFAAGVFNYRSAQWGLDLLTQLAADLGRAGVKANPAPAVLVAECLELCLAKGYAVPDGLAGAFRQTCLDAIADEIAIPARQALGLCLGRLGDPRILDLRDPAAYVEVPAGDYPYGEKDERVRIAAPFLLARYPTTNGQYRAFMEDGGYAHRDWWSDEGWDWLQRASVAEPHHWQDRRWNGPNQPVVGVSSWEAEACCRWAGGRLPTEHEWESATRGPQGYDYPWGGKWEDGICNSDEAGLGVTSPVGLFPRARQAQLAIDDLAGNCWEWCDDYWDRSQPTAERVLRGSAFFNSGADLRASFRIKFVPEVRDGSFGFRCAGSPSERVSVRALRPLPTHVREGESFNVFLSYNGRDKPTVRQLAQALQARGLTVWLDEEQLVPGRPWQDALERIIQATRSAVVLVGKDGLGPWEDPEMGACLSEFVTRSLPVILVLLPDAPVEPELPLFLRAFTWVDLRGGLTDHGLNRLEWGITGIKP